MTTPPPSGAAAGQDARLIDRLRAIQHSFDDGKHRVTHETLGEAIELLTRTPSPSEAQPSLTFTLREATALVDMFGEDDEGEATVRRLDAGALKDDDEPGTSPAGLWAHMTDYPEEGAVFLGDDDTRFIPAHPAPSPSEGVREAVPREPTEAMLNAAVCAHPYGEKGLRPTDRDRRFFGVMWRAMYDAALASSTVEETLGGEG